MVVEIAAVTLLSFQGSALERTAFEAPPRVRHAFTTQEAEPPVHCVPRRSQGTSAKGVGF